MSLATRNIEPIPGYTLRERIGAGGYGEVWKADAPGGLAKAIKLVYGYADGDRAVRESKALSLIKSLRHPFLLSLERIEIIDGQLVIVTELADCSLKDRFERHRSNGLRGIPRNELLQFMRDAADALDYMNDQHSLQHLDVKPENLLLVGEHVKVADFGLVKDVQKQTASMLGGLTPVYASPELFNGTASRKSDQYSLAIVYQEMLTGVLPFPGKTAAQLAAQHTNAKPLLFALPVNERRVISRALAKDPAQRFGSCRELVEYLSIEALQETLPPPETWFPGGPPREEVENVSSTMCLNTDRFSAPPPTPTPPAVAKSPAGALSYDNDSDSQESRDLRKQSMADEDNLPRTSDDMLSELDETSDRVDTEFSSTFILRSTREPRIAQVNATLSAEFPSLRPTVIVGIGRIAGMVMQKMKQRIVDRQQSTECSPAVQFLLLDADSLDIQRALRGDDGSPLDAQEVLQLELRKSQEYRNESPSLLQWISRRWLYNIPRSMKPEGMRPLGRLAFVDHARNIRDRLRKTIQKSSSAESLAATAKTTGLPCTGEARVIVLGAICGGTAGGMMLDLSFLSRQLLERLGHAQRDVTGMMLHYRGRQTAAHELAHVNTYATLAELEYYSRPEKHYPGDASCGLEPRKDDHSPFRDSYFVHLGDFLGDTELLVAAERVAEYIYLDCFTPVAAALQHDRRSAPPAKRCAELRSFGVAEVGFSSGEIVPWASMSLCTDLFRRWIGEGARERAEIEAVAEQEANGYWQSQHLNVDQLLQHFLTEIGKRLPGKPDSFFQSLLLPSGMALNATALAGIEFEATIARLNEVIGITDEEGIGPETKYPANLQQVLALADTMAKQQAQSMSQWVLARTQNAGVRMCGAEKAAAILSQQATILHDSARNQRRQIIDAIRMLERQLGGLASSPKAAALRKTPEEFEARYLEYVRLRMFHAALFYIQQFARRMKNGFTPALDQLSDTRRDLKGLIAQMNAGELAASEGDDLESQLRQALLQEFSVHRETLVQTLDTWLQQGPFPAAGGFLKCITQGGEHRTRFVAELFHNARSQLMQSLKSLNVASFLLEPSGDAENGSTRLKGSLDAAQPKSLGDGNCRTFVALAENIQDRTQREQLVAATAQHIGAQPALIDYRESDITVIREMANLAIADVAVRLVGNKPEFIEYARRVFTRSDIPFEPLAVQEDENDS